MHLLYLDESGAASDPKQQFFVLAGVSVFERESHWIEQKLNTIAQQYNDTQRGLMLLDKSSTETRIQTLAREFKYEGHSWGHTKNYAEVPVFLDSKASRLIQLADLVAFALFRFHEHGDAQFYDVIRHCFDADGPIENGLFVQR